MDVELSEHSNAVRVCVCVCVDIRGFSLWIMFWSSSMGGVGDYSEVVWDYHISSARRAGRVEIQACMSLCVSARIICGSLF